MTVKSNNLKVDRIDELIAAQDAITLANLKLRKLVDDLPSARGDKWHLIIAALPGTASQIGVKLGFKYNVAGKAVKHTLDRMIKEGFVTAIKRKNTVYYEKSEQ